MPGDDDCGDVRSSSVGSQYRRTFNLARYYGPRHRRHAFVYQRRRGGVQQQEVAAAVHRTHGDRISAWRRNRRVVGVEPDPTVWMAIRILSWRGGHDFTVAACLFLRAGIGT